MRLDNGYTVNVTIPPFVGTAQTSPQSVPQSSSESRVQILTTNWLNHTSGLETSILQLCGDVSRDFIHDLQTVGGGFESLYRGSNRINKLDKPLLVWLTDTHSLQSPTTTTGVCYTRS